MRKPLVEVDVGLREQDKVYITRMVSSTEFYVMKECLIIFHTNPLLPKMFKYLICLNDWF